MGGPRLPGTFTIDAKKRTPGPASAARCQFRGRLVRGKYARSTRLAGHDQAALVGDDDELGPVDFLAIEFPGGRLTAPGFEKLLSLADQGIVEILDMEFIAKDADSKSKKVDVWEFAVPDGVDLTAWAGRRRACSMTQTSARSPQRCSLAVSP